MADKILRSKALNAASKKLPIMPEKQLQKNLEFAADSLAEAYRLGAEETQGEIVERLKAVPSA